MNLEDGVARPGTLLRGPDGRLYFIPDEALDAFQVPDKAIPTVTEFMEPASYAIEDASSEPISVRAHRAVLTKTQGTVVNIAAES